MLMKKANFESIKFLSIKIKDQIENFPNLITYTETDWLNNIL